MIIEIIVALLIIIVVLLFLVIFKPWYLHIHFKNNNLDYNYNVSINFLLFNVEIMNDSNLKIKFSLTFRSKTIPLFEHEVSKENQKETDDEIVDETIDEDNEKQNLFEKIKDLYFLLKEAEEDLFKLTKLLMDIISFEESFSRINLGIADNTLTIKFCTLLWTLTAPLYPLGFKLIVTPEMNEMILKSDLDLIFKIRVFNILKVLIFILKQKNLRNIVKFLINR
jgi:hypothetical protein